MNASAREAISGGPFMIERFETPMSLHRYHHYQAGIIVSASPRLRHMGNFPISGALRPDTTSGYITPYGRGKCAHRATLRQRQTPRPVREPKLQWRMWHQREHSERAPDGRGDGRRRGSIVVQL